MAVSKVRLLQRAAEKCIIMHRCMRVYSGRAQTLLTAHPSSHTVADSRHTRWTPAAIFDGSAAILTQFAAPEDFKSGAETLIRKSAFTICCLGCRVTSVHRFAFAICRAPAFCAPFPAAPRCADLLVFSARQHVKTIPRSERCGLVARVQSHIIPGHLQRNLTVHGKREGVGSRRGDNNTMRWKQRRRTREAAQ